jgi:hypothetical protein
VAEWRGVAKARGLSAAQIERMSSAFEHDDARLFAVERKAPAKKAKSPARKAAPKPRKPKKPSTPSKARSKKPR